MNDNFRAAKQTDPPADPLPPTGEQVLVQGKGFRCLAFRDKDGKWRDVFHQTGLQGIVRVIKPD